MAASVLVGTSGWSHPGWVGPFYPVHLRAKPDAWLAYYATRFRAVEIASSFDAFPNEELVASWARAGVALQERGQGAFEFSLKLPRAITHDALPAGEVDVAREWAGRFDREVLDPLEGEGLLGVVLAQLPPRFVWSPDHAAWLTEALAPLAERKVALELRHASWSERGVLAAGLEKLFSAGDVCVVEADLPGGLDVRPELAAAHAYLRFHGRRGDLWARTQPRDGARYDYLYGRDELAPWAEKVRSHQRAGREVRAFFNNAPGGQAVANALDLKELIGAGDALPRPRFTAQQRLPL